MIASAGHGLPLDLLHATGRYAGPLGWNADRETPRASLWMEGRFSPWARSILEDWAEGAFDHLDAVVFSRADDAVQRLYYYVCELQRRELIAGPRALVFDLAKIPRPSSINRTIAEVRRLARDLAVSDNALDAAISETNRARVQATPGKGVACLLLGTPPPDRRLHHAIEDARFRPEGATLGELWRDAGPPIEEGGGDPAAAIGRQLHARPDDQRGFGNAAVAASRFAQATGARAAVQWYIEEDEARIWNAPGIRDALAGAGVETLVLTRRDWAASDGAIEEIGAFLAGVRA